MITIDTNAFVSNDAQIGEGTIIERNTQINNTTVIGKNCKIHRNIYLDDGVVVGDFVKIQDNVMIPSGVTIETGVFIGPSVSFTNDKNPRSITPIGELKDSTNWIESKTIVKHGASIGANATIVCGVTIGEWAMIGAGTVVIKDIPNHALVVGNPANIIGWVDKSGFQLVKKQREDNSSYWWSEKENKEYKID